MVGVYEERWSVLAQLDLALAVSDKCTRSTMSKWRGVRKVRVYLLLCAMSSSGLYSQTLRGTKSCGVQLTENEVEINSTLLQRDYEVYIGRGKGSES